LIKCPGIIKYNLANEEYRAGSLNHLAMPLPLPILIPLTRQVLPIKHGSLNHFPETLRGTLEDHWHC